MRLFEFEAAELFRQQGIPVPGYAVVGSPQAAVAKAGGALGFPVVIKAQVLSGGRGLAGLVRTANSTEEASNAALHILDSSFNGSKISRVMVARKIAVARGLYLSITIDGFTGTPVAILGTRGGVNINEVARSGSGSVVSVPVSITRGLSAVEAAQICIQAGLNGQAAEKVVAVLLSLYQVFRKNDALLAEINPLAQTSGGDFIALDAKVEIDNSSLYRHPEFKFDLNDRLSNALERKGREIGVTYIELDGDIATIASGAGLGMAGIDIISESLRPANFLETGGGITEELMYKVTDLVLQKPGIRALFINVYGGINPIHEGAKGVVRYLQEHDITIPAVAKALGNHQEETWQIFTGGGVHVVNGVSTEQGVALLREILGDSE